MGVPEMWNSTQVSGLSDESHTEPRGAPQPACLAVGPGVPDDGGDGKAVQVLGPSGGPRIFFHFPTWVVHGAFFIGFPRRSSFSRVSWFVMVLHGFS